MKQNRFFLNRNEPLGNFMDFKKMFHGDTYETCLVCGGPTGASNRICSSKCGQAYSRKTDPETSEQAAESVRGEEANRLESVVLHALRRNPNGLTSHELVEWTGVSWSTITPRIRPLVRKGLVVDSGERRQGCTNRKCVVWKAV